LLEDVLSAFVDQGSNSILEPAVWDRLLSHSSVFSTSFSSSFAFSAQACRSHVVCEAYRSGRRDPANYWDIEREHLQLPPLGPSFKAMDLTELAFSLGFDTDKQHQKTILFQAHCDEIVQKASPL
jgi:hypothetical protein